MIHRFPTADANMLVKAGRTPSSRNDFVSATPTASFGPCFLLSRHLDALATKIGETSGLRGVSVTRRVGVSARRTVGAGLVYGRIDSEAGDEHVTLSGGGANG